jgi:hypothetical protein
MSAFGRRQLKFERPARRRSPRSHFADIGDRVARAVPRQEFLPPAPEDDDVLPRFPIARQGYDCVAVDDHIAELERELADLDDELVQLRSRTPVENEVAAEIHRIGEQTSSILLAAHDKAQETTRRAQDEAERCVADAAANALAITEGANRQLREIEREMGDLSRQRKLLVQDIRNIAGALSSLAEEAETEEGASSPDVGSPMPVRADEVPGVEDETQAWPAPGADE